jgi:hypothetical protein
LYGKGEFTDNPLLDVLLITWKTSLLFEAESIASLNCESLVVEFIQRETNVENWFWLFRSDVRNQHSTVIFVNMLFQASWFPKLILFVDPLKIGAVESIPVILAAATWYLPFADIPTSCHERFVVWVPTSLILISDDDHDIPKSVDR